MDGLTGGLTVDGPQWMVETGELAEHVSVRCGLEAQTYIQGVSEISGHLSVEFPPSPTVTELYECDILVNKHSSSPETKTLAGCDPSNFHVYSILSTLMHSVLRVQHPATNRFD